MNWRILNDGFQVAYVSEREGDVKTLLGDCISMWARDQRLCDWDEAERMAAICFYHTDLRARDVEGIFGTSGRGGYPGEEPWMLTAPDGGDLLITMEVENPE